MSYLINFFLGSNSEPLNPVRDVFDGVYTNSIALGDRVGYKIVSAFSRYSFNYNGTSIQIRGKNTIVRAGRTTIEIYIDDTWLKSINISDTNYVTTTLPNGDKKVTLVTGVTYPDNIGGMLGTFLTGLILNTENGYAKINDQNNTSEYVFLGDSITVGQIATPPTYGYSELFYTNNKLSTTVLGYSGAMLADFAITQELADQTAAQLIGALKTSTDRNIIIALGTNDYKRTLASATFLTYAERLINSIYALDQSVKIYWNEPLYRVNETQLLQDYRDVLTSSALSSGLFAIIPSKNCVTYPSGYMSDGLHPNNAGHLEYNLFVAGYIL